jgi:hypothetical protein
MAVPSTQQVLENLWLGAGLPASSLKNAKISLVNASQHVLPSSFRIGCAAQASHKVTSLFDTNFDT